MRSTSLLIVTTVILFCFANQASVAQDLTSSKFGKGLKLLAKDSSFYMKFSTRIQTRFDMEYNDKADPQYNDRYYLRRARLKFDGWAVSPKLQYKMEFDVVNGFVLDAVVKYNVVGNLSIWAGQTKLPGNRERVVSSQKLQFVDRSQLNSRFNIDRDAGIQLRYHHNIGDIVLREIFSWSQGEGLNRNNKSTGSDYTGRVEILPFGNFDSKGDYFNVDLKREKTPKLAIGFTYGYNDNAIRTGGQLGTNVDIDRDLSYLFLDMMFKYQGLSIMTEYAQRSIYGDLSPVVGRDDAGNPEISFYTGNATNAQIGYLFKNNWEIAARITDIVPEEETGNNPFTEITGGLSKYVSGHNMKVQTDLTVRQEDNKNDVLIGRFQVELSF